VRPEDVWAEMRRRETMFGIAEKVPKTMLQSPPRRKSWPCRRGATASAVNPTISREFPS